ncbi:DUF4955 domain-containing protein [Bacteroides sp. KG68]|uniref:DUF4955 domain-containing protein n=1 Tax=unclassified Bacteroides TaxID=2646097 RepID=UPI003D986AB8
MKTWKYRKTLLLCACLFLAACQSDDVKEPLHPEEPPVKPEEKPEEHPLPSNTANLWREFLENKKKGQETTLADFSYAGYAFGEHGVPNVDYPVFNVCDYGAVPNDGHTDRKAFEEAIAAAQANGKGIVYAPAGRYDLRPLDAPNSPIVISGNNIVLRGDGCEDNGTELFMEYPNQPETAGALWSCPPLFIFRYIATNGETVDSKLADITSDAGRGTHTVEVSSTSGLYIGKRVILELKNKAPELVASEIAPYTVQSDWTDLTNNGVQVNEYHQVKRIEGNKVTFKEPILYPIEARWGWSLHEHTCRVGSGVEDIAFVGNFKETFVHHKNATHDSGFKMLNFLRQVNGWIRRCRFTDVSECVSVQRSANVSVYACRITGNGGHSAIRSEASTRIFIGGIADLPAQFHSTGVSKTAIGTVLWRNKTAANSCFESHAGQPRVTLLDACSGGFLPDHAGGDQAAAPNHLRELVLWNYVNIGSGGKFDLWVRNNRFHLPLVIGFQGSAIEFQPNQVKVNEHPGVPVYPESLYEAQLQERLGYIPQWLQELK